MDPSSGGLEDPAISPFMGSTSHGNLVVSHQASQSIADLEPTRAYSSTPDLQSVIVVSRKAEGTKPGKRFKTQLRSRAEHQMEGSRATPNLQGRPPVHSVQSRTRPISLRRTPWIPLSKKSKKMKDNPKRGISLSQSKAPRSLTDDPGTSGVCVIPIPGPNYELETLESIEGPEARFEDTTPFWENYNKMADFEDKEFVKALVVNLDTLLIFAGLFSAVNTSFIIEALQKLQPDQAEQTNDLIRSVILILHNKTFIDNSLHDKTFTITPRAFRTAAVFFISLTFSLTAASGAVMAKQWLNYYEREGVLKIPPARGRERQRKFKGRDQWNMEGVIETLPTLLQLSLFLFLIALVDFLWSIHIRLAYVVMMLSSVPVLFYSATTIIAAIYPTSPFQTRLSLSVRHLFYRTKDRVNNLQGQLVDYTQSISNLVAHILCKLRSPLAHVCPILPDTIPRFSDYLYRPLAWLRSYITFPYHFLTGNTIISSSISVRTSAGRHSPNPDDIDNIECLSTYIQRASIPQDLAAVLTGLQSLPIDRLIITHQSLVKSLVEASIKHVLDPWYHYARTSKQLSNPTSDMSMLLKILHLAYTSFDYGHHHPLLTEEGDAWVMQELFNAITRGHGLACSEENMEALVQNLARPSGKPHHYLPYLSLLLAPTHLDQTIKQSQIERILSALAFSMWEDTRVDMDLKNGALRLEVLPTRLGDKSDKYKFSRFLLEWWKGRGNDDREFRNEAYLKSATKLLDTYPNSCFWPEQLENDKHHNALLDIMQSETPYQPSFHALYVFLTLWCRRCDIVTSPEIYLEQKAVDTIVLVWEWHCDHEAYDLGWMPEVVKYTASYLKRAKLLGRLGDQNLANFVKQYRRAGDHYMRGDRLLPSLYEWVDTLAPPHI